MLKDVMASSGIRQQMILADRKAQSEARGGGRIGGHRCRGGREGAPDHGVCMMTANPRQIITDLRAQARPGWQALAGSMMDGLLCRSLRCGADEIERLLDEMVWLPRLCRGRAAAETLPVDEGQ